MPDRSLRLLTLPQQSAQPGERSAVLLRERPSSPPDTPSDRRNGGGPDGSTDQDNPFAPPPEGTPDRPWQPRHPSGDGDPQGSSGDQGEGGRSPWGGRWSDRQPGRSPGGFGERPGGSGGPESPSGGLALYWGISALRAKPRAASDPDTPAPPAEQTGRPQRTAAISGLVTSSLAILLVAASFGAQLIYSDYYTCREDALTNAAQQSCERHLPEQLRPLLGSED
ncbi:hypothetical protein [Streptomyces sp. MH60]|uniref:hypothetical protein n=1 Tax=Streptomyces sp. MH60 TaxID=1940758 RepID=UPI000CEF5816|nr:hypothetical protein [Streptomyces sp. MH60]PPS81742.1 hypothetical protein BZZ08_05411 [Streptomyces sp. MH60]